MNKGARYVKVTCPQCGYMNLVPVDRVFQILVPLRCRQCKAVIARPERAVEHPFKAVS